MGRKPTYEELEQRVKELEKQTMERRQAGEQLRFMAQLLDSVPESVVATDLEGRVSYWGKGAEALYGHNGGDVMGKPITFILEPGNEEEEIKRMEQVRETGSWSGRYVQRCKDGSSFWADTFIFLVTDENGLPSGLIGIDRDITERVEAEEALRESEARLRTAVESLPFDFFVIDKSGRYVMANSICRNRWGHFIGKKIEELPVDQKTLALWQDNNRRALSGEVVRGEVELCPGGEKGYYFNIISPIRDRGVTLGILGVNIDITALKLTEKALRESERRAREQLAELRRAEKEIQYRSEFERLITIIKR